MPGLNDGLSASAELISRLTATEGARNGGADYTDPAGNCTRGVGLLIHPGPCSAAELVQPADTRANNAELMTRIHSAEGSVRARVTSRQLTQAQFDSLVSAVFNLGAGGASAVLDSANRADDAQVVAGLRARVNAEVRGPGGRHTGRFVRLPGLVTRREQEAHPFLHPSTAAPQGPAR